jgi:hypothetical protein
MNGRARGAPRPVFRQGVRTVSHHFIIPTNENGMILDQDVNGNVALAMGAVFGFNDVFVFSHGWWTDATRAMEGYNRFTIEFSNLFRSDQSLAALATLSIGMHWPSTLSEDQFSLENYFQALSFYTMEKRADTVGENAAYVLLKLILDARPAPPRIHLLGHSFGCKVVCKALQKLLEQAGQQAQAAKFDVVLIQAAFDKDQLEARNDYGALGQVSDLRLLITRSAEDKALGDLYPRAHRLAHLLRKPVNALGADGPSAATVNRFGGMRQVTVSPGFDRSAAGLLAGRLVLADLTPLHQAHPENTDRFAGHHSDIFHRELYSLLAAFYFNR